MGSMKFPLESQWWSCLIYFCVFACDTPQYIIIMTNYTWDLGMTLVLDIHHLEVNTKFVPGGHLRFLISARATLKHAI